MSVLAEPAPHAPLRTLPARRRTKLPPGALAAAGVWVVVALFVVVPLGALVLRASASSASEAISLLAQPRVLAAFRTTFATSLVAALCDVLLALPVAWSLGRYDFPGRRLLDALVDMPLALPTSVAGLTLAALTSEHGPLGPLLAALGLRVAYTPLGITLALAFVGFPFVVRALEPVVHVLDEGPLEAAHSLGASRASIMVRVVLPQLVPAALTGFTVALARSLGEYGSIVFIAGNLPFKTEVVSYFIVSRLEDHEPLAATVLALTLLVLSGALLGVVGVLERRATDSLVPAERV
jgi:sulfate/thiosulfate transport system permease protein